MTNQHTEYEYLQIGKRRYQVLWNWNAISEIETELNRRGLGNWSEFSERLEAGKIGPNDFRILLWGGLLDQHPDITVAEAGEIIDRANREMTMEELGKQIATAFQNTFPAAENMELETNENGDGTKNNESVEAGTGND